MTRSTSIIASVQQRSERHKGLQQKEEDYACERCKQILKQVFLYSRRIGLRNTVFKYNFQKEKVTVNTIKTDKHKDQGARTNSCTGHEHAIILIEKLILFYTVLVDAKYRRLYLIYDFVVSLRSIH